MAEYIEREAAIKAIYESDHFSVRECFGWRAREIEEELRAVPAADVAPVRHGRWMHEETEGGFHIWRCSRCGRGINHNPEGTDLYCYHCGARMDGAE